MSNEWGRLAQGDLTGVEVTDTIGFIPHAEVPTYLKVTYTSFVCDHRSLKDEKWRIRLMFRGDRFSYDTDSGSFAIDLLETKV